MKRIEAETLLEVLGFYRWLVRDDALRSEMHARGIGDEAIDRALASVEEEARQDDGGKDAQQHSHARLQGADAIHALPEARDAG